MCKLIKDFLIDLYYYNSIFVIDSLIFDLRILTGENISVNHLSYNDNIHLGFNKPKTYLCLIALVKIENSNNEFTLSHIHFTDLKNPDNSIYLDVDLHPLEEQNGK